MGTDRPHPVIKTVPTPGSLALYPIQSGRVDDRACRPWGAGQPGHARHELRGLGRIGAQAARYPRARWSLGNVVTGDDPGTSDRILAEFHASRRAPVRECVNHVLWSRGVLHGCRRMRVCYNPRTKPAEMTEPSTPLMRQYAAIKKEHPSALLFFRLGDFYELFFAAAILASRELQITLTSRNKEKGV